MSALFLAPEKAGVRQPLLIFFPLVGHHFSFYSRCFWLGIPKNAGVA